MNAITPPGTQPGTQPGTTPGEVTVVTQTAVRPDRNCEFENWQNETSRIVAGFPGFVKETRLPPSPPAQQDWVIMQRFQSAEAAVAWLNSTKRQEQLLKIERHLTGRADVHVLRGGGDAQAASPVSAIISTRVKPGCEEDYRRWEQRVAVAQSAAPGLQGYRFEPPIPGVQDDWLAILRFDTEDNLQAWLDSPARQALVAEAAGLTEEYHYRVARSGFDQWFPAVSGTAKGPAVWKQNMLVLLMLYPVVFLFGTWVGTPVLSTRLHMPFPAALLVGNVASVVLLNWLVPWTIGRFLWWLNAKPPALRNDALGASVVAGLLAIMLGVFCMV